MIDSVSERYPSVTSKLYNKEDYFGGLFRPISGRKEEKKKRMVKFEVRNWGGPFRASPLPKDGG
jgi:hypothetical protein